MSAPFNSAEMAVPRSRTKIESEAAEMPPFTQRNGPTEPFPSLERLTLEVLLDIRDIVAELTVIASNSQQANEDTRAAIKELVELAKDRV